MTENEAWWCFQQKHELKEDILIAIHTFGSYLKRNVHIHLSVALRGLSFDGTQLVELFFIQKNLIAFSGISVSEIWYNTLF